MCVSEACRKLDRLLSCQMHFRYGGVGFVVGRQPGNSTVGPERNIDSGRHLYRPLTFYKADPELLVGARLRQGERKHLGPRKAVVGPPDSFSSCDQQVESTDEWSISSLKSNDFAARFVQRKGP